MDQLSHPYMTIGKIIAFTTWSFVGKMMFLLFNLMSAFIMVFLPRSKCLLISWLQSPYTVILEHKKIKSITVSNFPLLFVWSDGASCHLYFECWVWSQLFHSSISCSSRSSLIPLCFLPLKWHHPHFWGCWGFPGNLIPPACVSPSPEYSMMYSAYMLNKQGDTALLYSFPNLESVCWSLSGSNCCFLTYIQVSQRQVRWSGISISLRIFHSFLWFIQSKAVM